jgi:hypothetical protein
VKNIIITAVLALSMVIMGSGNEAFAQAKKVPAIPQKPQPAMGKVVYSISNGVLADRPVADPNNDHDQTPKALRLSIPITLTQGQLYKFRLEYSIPDPEHCCSSIRLHAILARNAAQRSESELAVSPWLGCFRAGPEPIFGNLPDNWNTNFDIRIPVRLGNRPTAERCNLLLQPEGRTGGCNSGYLKSWGGTVKLIEF